MGTTFRCCANGSAGVPLCRQVPLVPNGPLMVVPSGWGQLHTPAPRRDMLKFGSHAIPIRDRLNQPARDQGCDGGISWWGSVQRPWPVASGAKQSDCGGYGVAK